MDPIYAQSSTPKATSDDALKEGWPQKTMKKKTAKMRELRKKAKEAKEESSKPTGLECDATTSRQDSGTTMAMLETVPGEVRHAIDANSEASGMQEGTDAKNPTSLVSGWPWANPHPPSALLPAGATLSERGLIQNSWSDAI